MGKYPHEVAWMDQLAYAAECALRDYRPQVQPFLSLRVTSSRLMWCSALC